MEGLFSLERRITDRPIVYLFKEMHQVTAVLLFIFSDVCRVKGSLSEGLVCKGI